MDFINQVNSIDEFLSKNDGFAKLLDNNFSQLTDIEKMEKIKEEAQKMKEKTRIFSKTLFYIYFYLAEQDPNSYNKVKEYLKEISESGFIKIDNIKLDYIQNNIENNQKQSSGNKVQPQGNNLTSPPSGTNQQQGMNAGNSQTISLF